MPYRMKNQMFQNIGVPLEYEGQEKDMKELAKRMKMTMGRLVWHSLQRLYKGELTQIQQERTHRDGK